LEGGTFSIGEYSDYRFQRYFPPIMAITTTYAFAPIFGTAFIVC
jgi:hypothetical protein